MGKKIKEKVISALKTLGGIFIFLGFMAYFTVLMTTCQPGGHERIERTARKLWVAITTMFEKEGKQINVPKWQWITPTYTLSPDEEDTCGIDWGNSVVVVKRGEKESLVRYKTGGGGGTECDNRTTFMLANEKLAIWPSMTKQRALTEKLERDAVQKATETSTPEKASVLVNAGKWVDVKNVKPVRSVNVSHSYGDSCVISRGGWITLIGYFQNMHRIVRYEIPPGETRGGTQCPNDTIFFLSDSQAEKAPLPTPEMLPLRPPPFVY
ncbi:hypothetical protein ACFL29_01020 [Patescibacteria group bacterium]